MAATWGKVQRGDVIVCPHDCQPERVLFARRVPGRVHVRTSRHDHVRPANGRVNVLPRNT